MSFLLMHPETAAALGLIALTGLWLYFGWIRPIMNIRSPSVKNKTGHVLMLIILGISPIILTIFDSIRSASRNTGVNAAAGTSVNAGPGPQPVANNMRGALPVNRPSAAY